jgi:predicted HTH domain antitoxin
MKKLVLDIPDSLDLSEREAITMLAANLYENGKLSLGPAADMAGCTKRTFTELLGNFNVSIFNYDEVALENDIANAKRYQVN